MSSSQIPGAPLEIVATRKDSDKEMERHSLLGILQSEEQPLQLPFQLLREITDNFSNERLIGEGGFGVVYKGMVKNREVAVKILKPHKFGLDDDNFKNELSNLLKVRHACLAHVLGDCYDTEKTKTSGVYNGISGPTGVLPRLLCPEHLHNGSLQSPWFADEDDHCRYLPLEICLNITIGAAEANRYKRMMMETTDPIPMDPRPLNILLDDYSRAKLSDFRCTHNSPWDVEFAVTGSAKGGTEIKIGSNVIHVPKYSTYSSIHVHPYFSSVHHPFVQMLPFDCNKFDDSFSCLKSISPKSIYDMDDMAMRLSSSVWTVVCGADWISASRKSDSPKMGTISEIDTMNNIGWRKEPTENQSHHRYRGLYSASINDSGICVHVVDYAQGMVANRAMANIAILDTGSPVHCTGDISLFSDYNEAEMVGYVLGVGGGRTEVYGTGTISDRRFHMKDVLYIPGLNQSNLNKTILSVGKLCEDGYSVNFDNAGRCTVIDMRSRVWSWARLTWIHEIVGEGRMVHGQCHMDYLRMRAPVSSLEGIGVVKLLCNAASLVWSTITGPLHSQGPTAQRTPV